MELLPQSAQFLKKMKVKSIIHVTLVRSGSQLVQTPCANPGAQEMFQNKEKEFIFLNKYRSSMEILVTLLEVETFRKSKVIGASGAFRRTPK